MASSPSEKLSIYDLSGVENQPCRSFSFKSLAAALHKGEAAILQEKTPS
jgi:hypothetical protein